MMRSILVTALLVCLVPTTLRAGDDNPLTKAKVGDWIEYRMRGPNMDGKTKMTVVAKDDKELTFEVAATFSFMGKEMTGPNQTLKIDLTKPYDAIEAANLKRTGTKIDKVGEGTETIKVGEKEFDTKWTKLKCTSTQNGVTIVSEHKMWFSKNVPLSGLVRMDTTVGMFISTLEVIGSGSK
jgi:hypothetical protein